MNEGVKDILAKRRDRTIAILLKYKENEVDGYLPPTVRTALRKQILDQINDFYDLSIDILRSLDTGDVVMNDTYLAKLDEIHDMMAKVVEVVDA
jgi:hypothetical protein